MYGLEIPDLKSCWDVFPGHKSGRDKLLDVLKICEVFDEIFISPLQQVLHITFITNVFDNLIAMSSHMNVDIDGWFLKIRTAEGIRSFLPNRIAVDRGVLYPALVFNDIMDQPAFFNDYFDTDSTDLNFSFISIVDVWVWELFSVVIL